MDKGQIIYEILQLKLGNYRTAKGMKMAKALQKKSLTDLKAELQTLKDSQIVDSDTADFFG